MEISTSIKLAALGLLALAYLVFIEVYGRIICHRFSAATITPLHRDN